MKMNKDEKEILDSIERGEWKTISEIEKETHRYQKYARAAFRHQGGCGALFGLRQPALWVCPHPLSRLW